MKRIALAWVIGLALISVESRAEQAPPPIAQQRAAMVQQWLKASQAQLRGYQWVETTDITMDGEERSRSQNTCYYGADGKLQKVPAAGAIAAKPKGGPLAKKIAANMLQPGRLVQLVFENYLKAGDSLSIDIELPANRLTSAHVSTYLADTKDAAQLDVAMSVLPDGTIYSEQTSLDAPAKKMIVTIQNSGYRRIAG